MDLKAHYDSLYEQSIEKYHNNSYDVDNRIDSSTDTRYGITLLIRPPLHIKKKITNILASIRQVEPDQYFYPESDMHITVMSIISCYEGFELSQINIHPYVDLINKSLNGISPFEIEFKGLTASPSCLMVQGFLQDKTLNLIRDNLRKNFRSSDLQHSIDKRYAISTAHSTIFRVKENLHNQEGFLKTVDQYRDYELGRFKVDSVELVFNDWYQRKSKVKKLHEFKLG